MFLMLSLCVAPYLSVLLSFMCAYSSRAFEECSRAFEGFEGLFEGVRGRSRGSRDCSRVVRERFEGVRGGPFCALCTVLMLLLTLSFICVRFIQIYSFSIVFHTFWTAFDHLFIFHSVFAQFTIFSQFSPTSTHFLCFLDVFHTISFVSYVLITF